jgi:hypothetical protein
MCLICGMGAHPRSKCPARPSATGVLAISADIAERKLASDSGSDSDFSTFIANIDPRSSTSLAAIMTPKPSSALQVQDSPATRTSPARKRTMVRAIPPRRKGIAERANFDLNSTTC